MCLLPDNLVTNTKYFLEDYIFCNSVSTAKRVASVSPSCWIPHPRGCFQVNVDVAIDGSCGVCGFGLIIRDELGCVSIVKWMF